MNGIKIEYPWAAEVQRAFNQPRNPDGTFASIGGGGSAGSKKTDSKKKAKVKLSQGEQLKKDLALAKSIRDKLPKADRDRLDKFDADIEKAFANGEETITKFKKNGEWTPERRKKQQEIEDEFFANATPAEGKGRFIVTGGLPGSGKSTVLKARSKKGGDEFKNVIHVDSDAIKSKLDEYEGWNAALLHEESAEIADRIMKRAREGNYNVVYDATLKSSDGATKRIKEFTDSGYDTSVIFVDIPLKSSMERAISRSLGPTNRYVPTDYIATHDTKNVASLNAIKDSVTNWEHWDNSQPRGQEPTLVGSK